MAPTANACGTPSHSQLQAMHDSSKHMATYRCNFDTSQIQSRHCNWTVSLHKRLHAPKHPCPCTQPNSRQTCHSCCMAQAALLARTCHSAGSSWPAQAAVAIRQPPRVHHVPMRWQRLAALQHVIQRDTPLLARMKECHRAASSTLSPAGAPAPRSF